MTTEPAPDAVSAPLPSLGLGLVRPALLIAAIVLAGCVARPVPEQLVPTAPPEADMEQVRVFAMTDRASAATDPPTFGSDRGDPTYEAFMIAVAETGTMPDGASGAFTPERDLARDFTTIARQQLDAADFSRLVTREQSGAGAILVFVHGYNYSYQEGVFLLAELSADRNQNVVPVLFSWPSQATIRGYLADQDAATYARDDLADFLSMLARSGGNREIIVVGHSMGAWLVMESLRQLRLEGRGAVLRNLQVGLVAPDIDVDVFRAQTEVIGPLSPPIMVLAAPDDRALGLSRRLAGSRPRLGSISVGDPRITALVQETGVSMIDIGNLPAEDPLNHNRILALATLGSAISRKDEGERLEHAGIYILDVSGALLTAPFRTLEAIVAPLQGG